jgi:hypothetical protein
MSTGCVRPPIVCLATVVAFVGACTASRRSEPAPPAHPAAIESGQPALPPPPAPPASTDVAATPAPPAACAARPVAEGCRCTNPDECRSVLQSRLEPAIKDCVRSEWDCGFVELAFERDGCALPLAPRPRAAFQACLQRALDLHRWPCVGSTQVRIHLGSCTLM